MSIEYGFYSPKEVFVITTLSRTTIWRMVKRGEFPAPVRLSLGRNGWPKVAIHLWIRLRCMTIPSNDNFPPQAVA